MNLMQPWMTHRPLWAPQDDPAPGGDPAPVGDPAPPGDPAPSGDPAPDYSFLPEAYRTGEAPDIDGFKTHYDELIGEKAQRDEALALAPEDGNYQFAVPDEMDYGELDLPDDFSVNLAADDPAMAPLFEDLGGFLKKHNLPADSSAEIMAMLSKYEATKFSGTYAAGKVEFEALGTAAEARIGNVQRALEAKLPQAEADALKGMTTSANAVRAIERLLNPRGMTAPNPEPPASADPSDLTNRYPNTP